MKNKNLFYFSIFLSLTHSALAGTAQVNNVMQFGATPGSPAAVGSWIQPTTDISNMKVLSASSGSTTGNNYLALSNLMGGATGQYRVSANKILYCPGFYASTSTASGSTDPIQFGYGTAALIAGDTGTPPTGDNPYGFSATVTTGGLRIEGGSIVKYYSVPISFQAQSYPYVREGSAVTFAIQMICKEI